MKRNETPLPADEKTEASEENIDENTEKGRTKRRNKETVEKIRIGVNWTDDKSGEKGVRIISSIH